MPQDLLDAELMKKIERLSIASRKAFPGSMKGKRRSPKRGSSVEFADYRDYQMGDDFRFIDWNIYARLDKLLLKTFVEEENIYIHILLDVSRSMAFGVPSKLDYGKRIAATLAYIGLVELDMVTIATFSDDLSGQLRPMRGKDSIFAMLSFLEGARLLQETRMDEALKKYSLAATHPGIAIIISDFLVPQADYEAGLKAFIHKNFDVNVIQIMCEEEIHPPLSGELRLQDSETGETKEVTITDKVMKKYEERLASLCHDLDRFCMKNNSTYLQVNTKMPFEELILKVLRRERMLI